MTTTITDQPRIEVVSAIIIRSGKLLLQQRSAHRDFGGKWETPGGKVKPGEGINIALRRELSEELGVESFIGDFFNMAEFSAPVVALPLRIRFYRVDIFDHEPRCLDAIGLGWFDRAAVLALDMTPGTAAFRIELAGMLPMRGDEALTSNAAARAVVLDGALRACLGTGPKLWFQMSTYVTKVIGSRVTGDEFDASTKRIGATWDAAGKLCSLPFAGVSL